MTLLRRIKELILDVINTTECPFQPYDNPFTQMCDKRTSAEECRKCPWRNKEAKTWTTL